MAWFESAIPKGRYSEGQGHGERYDVRALVLGRIDQKKMKKKTWKIRAAIPKGRQSSPNPNPDLIALP